MTLSLKMEVSCESVHCLGKAPWAKRMRTVCLLASQMINRAAALLSIG